MQTFLLEWRLALHSRLASGAVLLLLVLSALAVWSGMAAVADQRAALARIDLAQRDDVAAVAEKYQAGGDAGYAAYSTPHLTVNAPSALAFAAFGQRDVQPFSLRVRLLGLQSQLYESESVNPELAAAGRYDYAFVLVYLAPLFVIALMHDLVTGERESGRLRLLASLPSSSGTLWRRRIALRYGLVLAVLLLPFLVGALLSGASWSGIALFVAASALYVGFWFGLSAYVAGRVRTSAAAAAILLAAFVVLTLVLPAAANAAIDRALPVSKGVQISLAQRQEVHQGWDLPKPETFDKFFRTHPEWRDTSPVTGRFHWKWYYAMHQAGDDAVAPRVAQYRGDMLAREEWAERLGYVLAPVNVQALLHRAADTDLRAQLAYQERVEAFHTRLRQYFYPFIFNDRSFGPAEFAALPRYAGEAREGSIGKDGPLALLVLAALAVFLGLRGVGRAAV